MNTQRTSFSIKSGTDSSRRPIPAEQLAAAKARVRTQLHLPDLPDYDWCDFRIDYESGLTLKDIAEKYLCDPRTVRKCLQQNRGSESLGSQFAPTKLRPYEDLVDQIFHSITRWPASDRTHAEDNSNAPFPARIMGDPHILQSGLSICKLSALITEQLRIHGYTGSERTVRNYLRCHQLAVDTTDDPN